MKKILAALICISLILSMSVGAFASELDFLSKTYTSYEGTSEMWLELNKPIEALATLNEDAEMDVKTLIEELCKMKIKTNIKADISDDYLSGRIYTKYSWDVPVKISEDLKLDAYVAQSQWIEYDFSDAENMKLLNIRKNPVSGKYEYSEVNVNELVEEMDEEAEAEIKDALNIVEGIIKSAAEEINPLMQASMEKHATVEAKDGYVTVTLTNDAMIDFIGDLLLGVIETEMVDIILEAIGEEIEFDKNSIDNQTVEMIKATAKGLGIFADDDALVMKAKIDGKGYMTECEESIHLDFNLFDVMTVLGMSEYEIYPLTQENSDIDLTIRVKGTYEKINEDVNVEFPVLTEENSVNLLAELEESFDAMDTVTTWQSKFYTTYSVSGKMDRGGVYVDAQDYLSRTAWNNDNLKGEVSLDDEGNVTILFNSDSFGQVTVTGNVNKNEYYLNGYELMARKPFMVVDEEFDWESYDSVKKVYVNVEVLSNVIGTKVKSYTVTTIDANGNTMTNPEYTVTLMRPNPLYVEPIEEEGADFLVDNASAVGIIGGADGPTEVFVMN